MMRTLFKIVLITAILTGILDSCSGAPHYDNRLVAVDTLLNDNANSGKALEQLSSINPSELSSQSDRAFYGLLATQARYKCYITATCDSDINRALDYYQHHGNEKDKLIRSYIYHGAVMEELGKPDTAMLSYKRAELEALENRDIFNVGYARLRMGVLYNEHHAYDGRDIEKFEQALDCFKATNNIDYQIVCLHILGANYRQTNSDKAKRAINQAIALAREKQDTSNIITGIGELLQLYFMLDSNKTAYQLLQQTKALDPNGIYRSGNNLLNYRFANIYSAVGMPDSAMYFLQLAQNQDQSAKGQIQYLEALSNIAKAKGDSITYLKLINECNNLTFSSIKDPSILNIMYAENAIDQEYAQKEEAKQRKAFAIVASVILALLALALLFYRRSHRYDKLVLELKDQSQSQMNDLTGLQGNISEMKINDERLKGFIASNMGMMREMIEACYHEPNNRIAENMKRIVKFQDSNRDNWVKLYDYIDLEHNNIMTRTRQQYPQLNDRDLLLLALTSMGFSYIQTAIIMGYSNATSVSVIKQRLAKKMGLDCSLNEYIEQYAQHQNEP